MLYSFLKFVHVVAAILWIGPPLGAYYFLSRAHQTRDEARILWSERVAERVLWFEHLALIALIASGAIVVWLSDWSLLAMPWLQKKLVLFAGVLVFESYDIWFAHVFMKRMLKEDVPLSDPRWQRAKQLRRWLNLGALPVLVMIPAILWFAIAKQ